MTSAVVVALSGVLYGLAFPPSPHPWLTWWALVPLLLVLRGASAARAGWLGWLWTFVMTCTVNDWFPRAVSGYFGQGPLVGLGLFVGVTTLTAGIQYAAFATIYREVANIRPWLRPWFAASAWVAADLARLWMFGGDPWALAGYSQADVLPIVQVADLSGVHGVTFLVVAVNASLAEAWLAWRARRSGSHDLAWSLAPAALAVALATAYGLVRLHALEDDGEPGRRGGVEVGIAQAHLPLGSLWKPEFHGRNLDAYLQLTRSLGRSVRPRLVVWPEASMTFFPADEPERRAAIAGALAPLGAELLAGGPFATAEPSPAFYNSAFLFSPRGEILGRYDKQFLLPFAEYLPLGWIDLFRRSFGRVRGFAAGPSKDVLMTAGAKAGVLVCNEGFFAEPASERVRDGATLLVNLSNDSWLGDAKYSEPAFDMVRLRAIEQRRWVVRASTSGPSALVAPTGRVASRSGLLTQATIEGAVEPRTGKTIYHFLGDAFAWACVAATGAAAFRLRTGAGHGAARFPVTTGRPEARMPVRLPKA
ncbi:MAG: hypothetical protein RL698_2767 [Pseudomonadota bacterium]|jgi:apolipoprotein N-acyltransferase